MSNFNTPILFLIFNRPETTIKVFDEIRKQKPKYLYIAADGPRSNHTEDIEKCTKCKEIVSVIDWNCEVKTLYRTENLGCGVAPSSAISWFFQHVSQGIILEDDCVPNYSFFMYCESLLEKYSDIVKIKIICGTSYQPIPLSTDTYYFSQYPHVWGWATWKRTWEEYNFRLDRENESARSGVIEKTFSNWRERKFWKDNMKMIINGLDAWDYQLMYWIWKNDGLCIVPWKNMIANIGFGLHGTHTFDASSKQSQMEQYELSSVQHPNHVAIHRKADKYERYAILISSNLQYYSGRFKAAINRLTTIFIENDR